jgi:peptidoglycan/LPS O-acetylase OafA/YrhL
LQTLEDDRMTRAHTIPGRIRSLDGLRAFAVLAVMGLHAGLPVAKGGGIGVDLFFVLSGYLITSLLLQEWDATGAISLRRFYLRRALRLLPALFVVLGLCAAYAYFRETDTDAANTYHLILYAVLYCANWARAFHWAGDAMLGHMWSLSIEEQFYFVWPLLLIGLLRARISRPAILVLLLLGVCTVALYRGMIWHGPDSFARTYNGLDTRADSLLVGCAVALIASLNWLPSRTRALWLTRLGALACTGILVYITVFSINVETFLRLGVATVIAIAVAVILITLLSRPPVLVDRLLSLPVLVWVGRISYSLYLWHFPVFHMLGWPTGMSPWTIQLLRFSVSFAAAIGSYYLIERPFLRLKNKLERKTKAYNSEPLPSENNIYLPNNEVEGLRAGQGA